MLVTTPARACGVRFALPSALGCYYVSCVKGALVLGMRSVFVFLLWWFPFVWTVPASRPGACLFACSCLNKNKSMNDTRKVENASCAPSFSSDDIAQINLLSIHPLIHAAHNLGTPNTYVPFPRLLDHGMCYATATPLKRTPPLPPLKRTPPSLSCVHLGFNTSLTHLFPPPSCFSAPHTTSSPTLIRGAVITYNSYMNSSCSHKRDM